MAPPKRVPIGEGVPDLVLDDLPTPMQAHVNDIVETMQQAIERQVQAGMSPADIQILDRYHNQKPLRRFGPIPEDPDFIDSSPHEREVIKAYKEQIIKATEEFIKNNPHGLTNT